MRLQRLSGCLVLKNGKVLLVKRSGSKCWEIPSSPVDPGDDAEEAAVRATEKQTGVRTRIVQQFDTLEYQKEGMNFEMMLFESDILEETEKIGDETIENAEWIDVRDLERERLTEDVKTIKDEIIRLA